MPTSKTWNGTSYNIPSAGELNWADLAAFLIALADGAQSKNAQVWNVRSTGTASETVGSTDMVVAMTNSAARDITAPTVAAGRIFCIIDGNGNAGTNNITINPNSGEDINGGSSYVINDDYGAVILGCDGTNWFGIASFVLDTLNNPMTTAGDVIYGGTPVGGVAPPNRLGIGSAGEALIVNGSGLPSWGTDFGAQDLTTTGDISSANATLTGSLTLSSGTTGVTALGFYGTASRTATFTFNGSGGNNSGLCQLTRVGNVVTLYISEIRATTGTSSTSFSSDSFLPAWAIPAIANQFISGPRVRNNSSGTGVGTPGMIRVTSSGTVTLYRDAALSTTWANTASGGFEEGFTFTYLIDAPS